MKRGLAIRTEKWRPSRAPAWPACRCESSPTASAVGANVARAELHGETAFLYLRDPAPAVAQLRGMPRLRFMHRRGNLEDLFLKLTGREMRE